MTIYGLAVVYLPVTPMTKTVNLPGLALARAKPGNLGWKVKNEEDRMSIFRFCPNDQHGINTL
jgi:hypothetical protein